MQKTSLTPEQYLDSLPPEAQPDMRKLHEGIAKVFAGDEIVLWEGKFWGGSEQRIVGYGNFSYVRSDKKTGDWFKVGLALQKNYVTVFVNGVEDGQYLAEKYKDELGKAKVGKSSVSFKKLADVNWDKLLELIAKARKQN